MLETNVKKKKKVEVLDSPYEIILEALACCDTRETFGDKYVGLLTGDSSVNKDAQIVIMTTEILRNMLYQRYSPLALVSGACLIN